MKSAEGHMAIQTVEGGSAETRPWPGDGVEPDLNRLTQAARRVHQVHRGRVQERMDEQLARGLGWFSVGLGLTQLVAPRALSQAIGVASHPLLMRAMGLRELACGVGILAQPRPTEWVRARVGGDLVDLALLTLAMGSKGTNKARLAAATAAVAGVTALDVMCARQLGGGLQDRVVEKSVTINRSPRECYEFWRMLSNLPRFMKHVQAVQVIDDRRSHWVVTAPAGRTVEWDAEITEDIPGQMIAWHSLADADVTHAGSVRFEPAPPGRGTIVRVVMHYQPPAGTFGAMAAKLFGEEPEQQVYEDLRRFKQIFETGEIPTTKGQPAGRRSLMTRAYRKFINADSQEMRS
jgi:uncharacterized membrane protein